MTEQKTDLLADVLAAVIARMQPEELAEFKKLSMPERRAFLQELLVEMSGVPEEEPVFARRVTTMPKGIQTGAAWRASRRQRSPSPKGRGRKGSERS